MFFLGCDYIIGTQEKDTGRKALRKILKTYTQCVP